MSALPPPPPADAGWRHPDTRRAVFGLAVVLALVAIVAATAFDPAAKAWAAGVSGAPRALFQVLTRFGKSDWLLIPLGVAALLLHVLPRGTPVRPVRDLARLTRRVDFLLAAIAVSGLLAVALKYGLGVPRPSVLAATGPIRFTLDPRYASFPSGHATTAAAFATALTLIAPWTAILAWPFAVLVAVSRMVVGAHHLSDVVAGFTLGTVSVIGVAAVLARRGYGFSARPGRIARAEPYPPSAVLADLAALLRFCLASARALADTPRRPAAPPEPAMTVPSAPAGLVSVVIPAKDEAENLAVLIAEILAALDGRPHEVVVVDDGSTDGTAALLARLKGEGAPVRHVRHERPCGQSAAVRTGVLAARGDVVVTIDGDGQNDPAYIPALLAALEAAGPAVALAAGQRLKRTDGPWKKAASRFANGLRGAVLKDGTRDSGCGLKAVRRTVFLLLPYFDGWHRFLPALVIREGHGVTHVDVVDRPRRFGRSNYGIFDRGLRGALDLFGVWWLLRRRKRIPVVSEIGADRA